MHSSLLGLLTIGLASIANAAFPQGTFQAGNPFKTPDGTSTVTAGVPFDVTWDPTTPTDSTITILICKGPGSNCVTIDAIATGIKNTGVFKWTPSTALEPTENHQGYGLQLIVESTGQFQYTTQFGISNPSYRSSSSASTTGTASSSASSGASSSSSATSASSASSVSSASTGASSSAATVSATSSADITSTATEIASTGMPANSSIVMPTGSLTVPSSLQTTTTAGSGSSGRPTGSGSGTSSPAAAPTLAAKGLGLAAIVGMGVGALVL